MHFFIRDVLTEQLECQLLEKQVKVKKIHKKQAINENLEKRF